MDLESQEKILRLSQAHDPKDLVVLIGAPDPEAAEITAETVVSVTSFGFARGLPRGADLVFDMRFLRNPHWVPALKPGTGLDTDVAAYIAEDPVYEPAVSRIEDLLALLLPRYAAEGPYLHALEVPKGRLGALGVGPGSVLGFPEGECR